MNRALTTVLILVVATLVAAAMVLGPTTNTGTRSQSAGSGNGQNTAESSAQREPGDAEQPDAEEPLSTAELASDPQDAPEPEAAEPPERLTAGDDTSLPVIESETGQDPAPEAATQPDATAKATDETPSTTAEAGPPTNTATTAPADTSAQPQREIAYQLLPPENPGPASIGALDGPEGRFKLRVELTSFGAGVQQIQLAAYKTQADDEQYGYTIMRPAEAQGGNLLIYPFAARRVYVDGKALDLQTARWSLKRQTETEAHYVARIGEDSGKPVLEIHRRYSVREGHYDLFCDQRFVNLADRPLKVAFEQNLQSDVPGDVAAYLGDRRQFTVGYFKPDYDPARRKIYSDGGTIQRFHLLQAKEIERDTEYFVDYRLRRTAEGKIALGPRGLPMVESPEAGFVADLGPVWPNEGLPDDAELAWLAATNRYFTLTVHPPLPPRDEVESLEQLRLDRLDSLFPTMRFQVVGELVHQPSMIPGFGDQLTGKSASAAQMVLFGRSRVFTLAPGQSEALDLALFAGPREGELFSQYPYDVLQLSNLLVYQLGCTVCTFQWLAKALLAFLEALHDHVLFDWGLAIIALVAIVRLLLHPITKQSQTQMTKMGEQMAALQPELEKLKKQYADDPDTFQKEQLKLMREKGVNPFGCLGVLPLFLQMPIWIALYAMLYYAIELRHEAAFYGVFQLFGDWAFLGDLSRPDNFIQIFSEPLNIPLLVTTFPFSGINVLPILWAGLMFINQKLMSPPPANEQMAQQQKIMQYMLLVFPLFLYNAPSGLTLYIMASTVAGIVDSYLVRKHIQKQKEEGKLLSQKEREEKKKPKEGSWQDRMQKWMEEKQKEVARLQGEDPRKGPGKDPMGRGKSKKPGGKHRRRV